MGRLDEISLEELQELKAKTEGAVPRERVLAAIGRKQGDTLEQLAERHDVVEKTIRNWLDRFSEYPLEEAPYDEDRPGRPPILSDEQYERLFEDFRTKPTNLGYDRQAWTTSLATHHIKETYGVEYTERHVRTLMKKAGLSWRKGRPRHHEADPAVEAEFKETVQKKTNRVNCRRSNCRCRRPVYQTYRNGPTKWLVPNRLQSTGEGDQFVGQGHRSRGDQSHR